MVGNWPRVPRADETERALCLGLLVPYVDADLVASARTIVEPNDFHDPDWRDAFNAICRLHDHGCVVDKVSVAEELRRTGRLESLGGPAALAIGPDLFVDEVHIRQYATMVHDASERRAFLRLSYQLAQGCDNGATADQLLALVAERWEKATGGAGVGGSGQPTTGSTVHYPELTSMAALLAEPQEAEAWVVHGLLAASGVSMLISKPKVGKTITAQNLALAVARGEPFLGRATRQGPVVYLALENRRRLVRKHFAAMGGRDDDLVYFHIARTPQDASAWLKWAVETYKPVLVIIDTLQRFVRLRDIKDYAEAINKTEAPLQLARDSGAHIMFIHHATKADSPDDVDAALGSIGLSGTVDTILRMKKTPADVRTIAATTMREGEEFEESVLTMDRRTFLISVAGTRAEVDEKAAADKIAAYLESVGEPIEQAAIFERVEGRTAVLSAALKSRTETRAIFRTGSGKKGDPFKYSLPPFPDSIGKTGNETKNPAEGPENRGLFLSRHSPDAHAPERESATGPGPDPSTVSDTVKTAPDCSQDDNVSDKDWTVAWRTIDEVRATS